MPLLIPQYNVILSVNQVSDQSAGSGAVTTFINYNYLLEVIFDNIMTRKMSVCCHGILA